jgi:hypothetical protein
VFVTIGYFNPSPLDCGLKWSYQDIITYLGHQSNLITVFSTICSFENYARVLNYRLKWSYQDKIMYLYQESNLLNCVFYHFYV